MIDLFDYNDKDNNTFEYEKFISKKLSIALQEDLNDKENKISELNKKLFGKLYKIFSIAVIITTIIASILIGFIYIKDVISFKKSDWIISGIMAFIVIILLVVITFIHKRIKIVSESDVLKKLNEDMKLFTNELVEDLDIPLQNDIIDFLMTINTKKKNGKIKKDSKNYMLFYQRIYKQNECLLFSDLRVVISIPINTIKEINKISKKISFLQWNKEETHNSKKYKQYKIKRKDYSYFIKYYYQIVFCKEGKEYYINIPNYEIDTLLKYLGNNIKRNF